MIKRISIFCSLFLIVSLAFGQVEDANPFDLTPRIKAAKEAERAAGKIDVAPANPFDIVRSKPAPLPDVLIPEISEEEKKYINVAAIKETFRRFFFIAFMGMLVLLTISFTLFRNSFAKAWRAFLNDNMLTQIHREQGSIAHFPYLLMNLIFFVNLALFIMSAAHIFDLQLMDRSNWEIFFILLGAIIVIFVLKHLLIKIIANVFPLSKEMRLYAFTITIFCAILGLFLIPLNALLAYAPDNLIISTFWISIGVVLLTYLFRALRSFFIGGRYLASHQFHFLLYICAVEIAPLLILIRLILNQG